ncbi:unnamed protein product [Nezara viridula]|uniref:Uncharacterized protein n=1 Tax=Nezara viridula TaxID=85310 RepID=A0A9P0MVZ3_NEZVI|nr:unnamed protein product [Nezara viridula]
MENTAVAKVGAMLALGGTALAFTLLPLIAARRCSWGTQPLLRFGGGVLLATTFLHLLPELREGLENSELGELPEILPELLMCLGFFLMYFVEELAHIMLGAEHHDPNSEKRRLCNDHEINTIWTEGTPLRAIMITVAISVHQVFEGLAVGLEGHSNQVWILTGAIAAHKSNIVSHHYTELKLLFPSVRRQYFIGTFLYQIINNHRPSYAYNLLQFKSSIHSLFTRSRPSDLYIPSHRSASFQNSFIARSVNFWNSLPIKIRHFPSLSTYKTIPISIPKTVR